MLLLTPLAFAEAAMDMAPCGGFWIVGTQPTVDQSGVPLDAPLRVQLDDNGCPMDETLTVQLRDAVGEIVEEWSFTAEELAASKGVVTMDPAEELAPLSAYVLGGTLSGAEEVVIHFSTGEGLLGGEGEGVTPAFTWLEAWGSCEGGASLSWSWEPMEAGAFSMIEVYKGSQLLQRSLPDVGSGYVWDADARDEVCLTPVLVNGAGVSVAGEDACAEVVEPDCGWGSSGRGCSTGGGLALLAPALLAAMGLRRKPQ